MPQKTLRSRLMMSAPLFVLGAVLTQVDFGIIWRYFGFANQSTAVIMLWTASAYLLRHNKFHWISTVPALFMTTVCLSFILNSATLGFGLPMQISTILGFAGALIAFAFVIKKAKGSKGVDLSDVEPTPEAKTKTA